MELGTFDMTHSLNFSHVNENPNNLLRNKNSAWTRAEAKGYVGGFLMLRVSAIRNLFQKGIL
jgi:hypothetical protein